MRNNNRCCYAFVEPQCQLILPFLQKDIAGGDIMHLKVTWHLQVLRALKSLLQKICLNWWLVVGTACIGVREYSYNVNIWTESYYCLLIPTYSVVAIFFLIPVPKGEACSGPWSFPCSYTKGKTLFVKNRFGLLHNLAVKICKLWVAGHLVTCTAACKDTHTHTHTRTKVIVAVYRLSDQSTFHY